MPLAIYLIKVVKTDMYKQKEKIIKNGVTKK